jgi:hypothetical protein
METARANRLAVKFLAVKVYRPRDRVQVKRRKLQVVGEMARARLTTSEHFKVTEKMHRQSQT